jgi:hypothetical protein
MTAILSSPAPARPLVRIRRAPALEPPADDDRRPDDHPVCAGQLALFTSVPGVRGNAQHGYPGAAAARPARGPTGSTDPSAGQAEAGQAGESGAQASTRTGGADGGPARTSGAGADTPSVSAPAQVAAGRFVAVCVEVLNGFRPAGHLRALTTPFEFATISTQLTRRAVRVRMPNRDRTGQERVRVRRLRVFEQRAGVAEAVAVLHHGEASWAIALRFEHRRGSWLCTLLEVV